MTLPARIPAAPSPPAPSVAARSVVTRYAAKVVVAVLAAAGCGTGAASSTPAVTTAAPTAAPATTRVPPPTATTPPPTTAPRYLGWVDPTSSGRPWGTEVDGLLTFRGNPTRSYHGRGPVPKNPVVLWRYPRTGAMCGRSSAAHRTTLWCGTGWTGQPAVWEQDGRTWIAVGAYDKHLHFIDAATGGALRPPFPMGDIVKGSVTRDPDGFPLLYSGSRADFHIVGLDRPAVADLWSMDARNVSPTKWNDDWDGSPLVIDDHLFEGGENGQWYVVKLNRGRGADGRATVAPEIVFHAPGWDDQLLRDLAGSGARASDVSIESSLAISGNTVYFANSGGLVQGWDITKLKTDPSSVRRVFRFWTGDDTDASVVVDEEGYLYVASERERTSSFARDDEVGQLMKLDPRRPADPLVWKVNDPPSGAPLEACDERSCHGIWATPALGDGVVYAATNQGRLLAVDRHDGKLLWEKTLPEPTWSSPVVVDDVLIQGDCHGGLHAYDVSDPRRDPPELWTVRLDGCIESTPAVFEGRIYIGTRGGAVYAIGDAPA